MGAGTTVHPNASPTMSDETTASETTKTIRSPTRLVLPLFAILVISSRYPAPLG